MTSYHAFLINLDRSQGRLATMDRRLRRAGLSYSRVAAVDGTDLDDSHWRAFDAKGYDFRHGKSFNPNELGAYLSHIKALEAFLASGYDFGLILEDDATFAEDTALVLDSLVAARDKWDVVTLSGMHRGTPVPLCRLTGRYRLVALLTNQTGAAGYLVNRFAARRYVERLLPMRVPIDHAFDRAWHFGFRFRSVAPRPIGFRSSDGSQTYGPTAPAGSGIKKPWRRRGSVFAYRSYNEARRVLHYASRGLFIPRTW